MRNIQLGFKDSKNFENFTRMLKIDFENLLQLIRLRIRKKSTFSRTISARQRTLRFLVTGFSLEL